MDELRAAGGERRSILSAIAVGDIYERKMTIRKVIATTATMNEVASVNGLHHRGIQNSFPVRLVTRILPARISGRYT